MNTTPERNDKPADLCEGASLHLVPPTSPLLRTAAEAVTDVHKQVLPWEFFMRELMQNKRVFSLAAQQVGIPLAFFVSGIKGIPLAVNPRVMSRAGGRVSKQEGSLNFPGRTTYMARAPWIVAEWAGRDGQGYSTTLRDFDARVFQHMCDQLAGLCIFPL